MLIKVSEIRENKGRRLADVAKVEELAESIEQIGLINPITVAETNNQYLLVAGLHRLEAYKLLGKDKIEASILTGTDLELELAEIDENLVRNELHYTELDDLILRKKAIYEEMYPDTKHGGDRKSEKIKTTLCRFEKPSFSKDTSDKTGQSERNIQRSTQRAENLIPEAKPILREKDITKTEATILARQEPEVQKKIIKILQDGKVETVKKAKAEIKKQEVKEAVKDIPIPEGKFNVIYCDPPWRYNFAETSNRAIENQYPTMKLEDIKELDIPADENAVLYMWATAPKLREALDVIKAWGFEYKTNAVWDKEIIGMGYWFRGQHEILMVAVKGKFSPPTPDNRYSSVISEKRTRHSQKPKKVYEMIEKMYPNGKYIELFSRHKHNERWEVWGNQL